MSAVGAVEASCRRPVRSWPDASWTAPNVAKMAIAAKNALKICDMTFCPAPQWRPGHNPSRAAGGPALSDHLTVFEKNLRSAGTNPGGSESSRQPVIPPAPLTGDVGCDRGDAGRTLLFCVNVFSDLRENINSSR